MCVRGRLSAPPSVRPSIRPMSFPHPSSSHRSSQIWRTWPWDTGHAYAMPACMPAHCSALSCLEEYVLTRVYYIALLNGSSIIRLSLSSARGLLARTNIPIGSHWMLRFSKTNVYHQRQLMVSIWRLENVPLCICKIMKHTCF